MKEISSPSRKSLMSLLLLQMLCETMDEKGRGKKLGELQKKTAFLPLVISSLSLHSHSYPSFDFGSKAEGEYRAKSTARLKCLEYFVTSSNLLLTKSNIDSLWDTFVTNSRLPLEEEDFWMWLDSLESCEKGVFDEEGWFSFERQARISSSFSFQ